MPRWLAVSSAHLWYQHPGEPVQAGLETVDNTGVSALRQKYSSATCRVKELLAHLLATHKGTVQRATVDLGTAALKLIDLVLAVVDVVVLQPQTGLNLARLSLAAVSFLLLRHAAAQWQPLPSGHDVVSSCVGRSVAANLRALGSEVSELSEE